MGTCFVNGGRATAWHVALFVVIAAGVGVTQQGFAQDTPAEIGDEGDSGMCSPVAEEQQSACADLDAGNPSSSERSSVGAGYELALFGSTQVPRGDLLHLSGIAYRVRGASDLSPAGSTVVRAQLIEQLEDEQRLLSTVSVRTDADGHFSFSIAAPDRPVRGPTLRVEVGTRSFEFSVYLTEPASGLLRSDRELYEPGESAHLWGLLTHARSGRPLASAALNFRVVAPDGTLLLERPIASRASGSFDVEVPLTDAALSGTYQWSVETALGGNWAASFNVGRRTVERMLATMVIQDAIVRPGGRVHGTLTVTSPSGSPVRGAQVSIADQEAAEGTTLQTDREGKAVFELSATSFIRGAQERRTLLARITHPSYGTVSATGAIWVARSRWSVEAVARGGGLIPGVRQTAYVSIASIDGVKLAPGATVTVEGLGVQNRRFTGVPDQDGVLAVPMMLRAEDIAGTDDAYFTSLNITLPGSGGRANAAVSVAPKANVAIEAEYALYAPTDRVNFSLTRTPSARNGALIVELVQQSVVFASAWVAPNANSGSLALPNDFTGVASLRVRPVASPSARNDKHEPGATLRQAGGLDALVIRPRARTATLTPTHPNWHVRDTVELKLGAGEGWASVLVRDETAQGGEREWQATWRGQSETLTRPELARDSALLRAAIAQGLTPDPVPGQAPPLTTKPWEEEEPGEHTELRDPIDLREEYERRTLGRLMTRLEELLAQSIQAPEETRATLLLPEGRGFRPDAIERLVEAEVLSTEETRTLGDEILTTAMLTASDPSFTFDNVARRVARKRMADVYRALVQFTNPDNEETARVFTTEPVDRWLSHVPAELLLDPWGRAFVWRRTSADEVVWTVSDRAPEWELVCKGPDGKLGTTDDLRDPFARILPQGTVYAVASGEDRAMNVIARIAVGERVLKRMLEALNTESVAAADERNDRSVTAEQSEGVMGDDFEAEAMVYPSAAPAMQSMADEGGYGGLGAVGTGSGYGRGAGRAMRIGAESPVVVAERAQSFAGGSRLAAAGEIVRERFPATLFFTGEVALNTANDTILRVPLADALTTYRAEAIVWTPDGFVTSTRTDFRVTTEATIDAPVPPLATTHDDLRIPVRLVNHSEAELSARIDLSTEGSLEQLGVAPVALVIPAGEAREVVVAIRLHQAGEGSIVVRAVGSDGRPLDAVRRKIRVEAPVRHATVTAQVLIENSGTLRAQVPEGAVARGPATLRVSTNGYALGSPMQWEDNDFAGWAYAFSGTPVPAELLSSFSDPGPYANRNHAGLLARRIGTIWKSELSDAVVTTLLESLTRVAAGDSGDVMLESEILLGLAPASRHSEVRPAARPLLDALTMLVADRVADLSVAASDAPMAWISAAAALASVNSSRDARVRELLRRVDDYAITVNDRSWLEWEAIAYPSERHIEPSALYALALIGLGERTASLPWLRDVVALRDNALGTSIHARAYAWIALATLRGPAPRSIELRSSALRQPLELRNGVASFELPAASALAELRLTANEPSLVLATLEAPIGVPWPERASDAEPGRTGTIDLSWSGTPTARDTRSRMALVIKNRSATPLLSPVVEVSLPAGAELDEQARQRLSELGHSPATIDEGVLVVHLPKIFPGQRMIVPIAFRTSVGGDLFALGVSLYDSADRRPTRSLSVLGPRSLRVADEGEEGPEAEIELPTPPPIPPPIWPLIPFVTEGDAR